jgi:hypothetical protein
VKKFERIWFEFEKRRLFEKEFEKEKKKTKEPSPPIWPSGPSILSHSGPSPSSPFSFSRGR